MLLFWNSDPNTSAAGRCLNIFQDGRRSCIIDLYGTLCNSAERLIETLVHEMCHAACWIIDGVKFDNHNDLWKSYGEKVTRIHPELPPVSELHNYHIPYKVHYICTSCYRV
ncbi:Germ cell nuclear acidic peptidase [Pristimantis euphronides]